MKHLTSATINHPNDAAISHLEGCVRCRSRITTDVDLEAVRDRILDEIGPVATSARPSHPARPGWWTRPWAVAAIAAAAVVAVFVPMAWLNGQSDSNLAGGSTPSTLADTPVVDLPTRPIEPSEDEVSPPTPPTAGAVEPFEMEFTVGNDAIGLLIWQTSTFYEGVRVDLTDAGAVYDYGFFRTGDNQGISDPDNSSFDEVELSKRREVFESTLPDDADLPWQLLIERLSDTEMWDVLTGGDTTAIEIAPSHPDATQAWSADRFLLETTADGIPVVVDGPGHERFEAVDLERRMVRPGEVGNYPDLSFDYAVYLGATTTDDQRSILSKGFVTFASYRSAAEAAAECAGTTAIFDEAVGMYTFPTDVDTQACTARFVDDIAEVWRVASRWIGDDEFMQIFHLIRGEPDAVEMYQSEEGPELALASGDGWAISISSRGPGFCTRTSERGGRGSYGGGCHLPSQMRIPDIIGFVLFYSSNSEADELSDGSILGTVIEDADRITVRFDSGAEREIVPGATVELGFRGFGMLFDAGDLGLLVEVEVLDGSTSLGVYEIDLEAPSERWQSGTGDG